MSEDILCQICVSSRNRAFEALICSLLVEYQHHIVKLMTHLREKWNVNRSPGIRFSSSYECALVESRTKLYIFYKNGYLYFLDAIGGTGKTFLML